MRFKPKIKMKKAYYTKIIVLLLIGNILTFLIRCTPDILEEPCPCPCNEQGVITQDPPSEVDPDYE